MRRCDFFCLPSIERSESFGIASAEAMSFGKPTIVCELHNGVNYLNQAGETSLVTPPRDEAALADAIDQLANDTAPAPAHVGGRQALGPDQVQRGRHARRHAGAVPQPDVRP